MERICSVHSASSSVTAALFSARTIAWHSFGGVGSSSVSNASVAASSSRGLLRVALANPL